MAIGFLALVVAGGTAVWAVNRNRAFAGWVDHTYLVERQLSALRFLIERAEAARRGYLVYPDTSFETVYRQTVAEIKPTLDAIADLTRDNATQQQRIAQCSRRLACVFTSRELISRMNRVA